MNNRPTPETDAESGIEMFDENGQSYISQVVDADFARKLERERDEAREQAAMWKANHDNQVSLKAMLMDRPDLGDRASRIAELIRERDEARQALRKAIRFVEAYEPHSRGSEEDQNETLSIIRKVLEGVK